MGNIKILPKGMETCSIKEEERDKVVLDFLTMKNKAEDVGDLLYASSLLYSYHFSYGDFLSGLVYKAWKDIVSTESLKGIKERTIELFTASFKHLPKTIDDAVFNNLEEPRTSACFKQPILTSDYIYDENSWQKWHHRWFTNNQEKIDWSRADNGLFPQPAIIESILKEELLKHQITPNEEFVNQFHEKVMRHKGTELVAYADVVGTKICKGNYYIYEQELSKNEQKACGSLRKIFSIINKDKKKQYISIDFAHGMFELHDEHGNHKGEFRFDGSYNADSETNHCFKTL